MPGVGVRTAARILLEVGDGSSFPTAAHLAAHAGLHRSPTAPESPSAASARPGQGTSTSSGRSSSAPSPPYALIRSAAPTTTASEPKARSTTPPSSAWRDAAATSCTPCSRTRPPTSPDYPPPLDAGHRDTPRLRRPPRRCTRRRVAAPRRSSPRSPARRGPCRAGSWSWSSVTLSDPWSPTPHSDGSRALSGVE